jgi:hypothetical protein
MLRSTLAVLAGIAVLTVTSFAIEAVAGRFLPFAGQRVFTMLYTLLCIAAGGFVTAWIARRSPVRHAAIMGAIEAVMTVGAMFAMRGGDPLWIWILSIALIVPAAALGGAARARVRLA